MQQILDTVGDPIFVKDKDHRWIFLNDAFCEFMGHPRSALLGCSDYDFFPDHEAEVFWEKDDQVFRTGEPSENEETFTDADGHEHTIITKKTLFTDSRGNPVLVGIIRDITHRKQLEARLAMTRRLMSLGTLASGVAHEINNPLAFVFANLEFVLEALDDAPPSIDTDEWRRSLQAAFRGAERVRDTVEGLRAFSDAQKDLIPVDLADRLAKTVSLIAAELEPRAEVIEDYREVPRVEANPQPLDQIFLNLLLNAAHAVEEAGDGHHQIRITTYANEQNEVVAEVSDTGTGIHPDELDRIFDPFYTTKPVGRGTGLGLSISHALVEAIAGRIEVDSTPGKGTTFRVVLPPLDKRPCS